MLFAYARTSTIEQGAESAVSIPEQLRKGRALASMRGIPGNNVITVTDKGVSGSTPLAFRPQGKEMMEAAQDGDVICASKMDRLFRSAIDALQTAEELKKRGVELVLLDIGIDAVTGHGVGKGREAQLEEDEREQEMLAKVRELAKDGRKTGKIARYLTKHHPTRSGRKWQCVQVQRLIARVEM